MKKNRRSKTKRVNDHFSLRCLERLGYIPDMKKLVKAIQNGELTFLQKQSNRVTRWLWIDPINNIECIIPYDKDRKQIITVLFMRREEDADKTYREQ